MKAPTLLAAAAAAIMLATGLAGAARVGEAGQDARDAAAIAVAHVTLPQAIATAEQRAGGRAVSADLVADPAGPRIAVEIAAPHGVQTVTVDAVSGAVVANRDHDEDEDASD